MCVDVVSVGMEECSSCSFRCDGAGGLDALMRSAGGGGEDVLVQCTWGMQVGDGVCMTR